MCDIIPRNIPVFKLDDDPISNTSWNLHGGTRPLFGNKSLLLLKMIRDLAHEVYSEIVALAIKAVNIDEVRSKYSEGGRPMWNYNRQPAEMEKPLLCKDLLWEVQ